MSEAIYSPTELDAEYQRGFDDAMKKAAAICRERAALRRKLANDEPDSTRQWDERLAEESDENAAAIERRAKENKT